jgi:hypothetical protein
MTPADNQRTRIIARWLPGASLAVIGSLITLGGGGVLAAFGTDGGLASGPHLLSTPASAVVSPITSIKHTADVTTIAGQPTLRISARPIQGTGRVFVGIARAADVKRYLAGVSTQDVTRLSVDPYAITGTLHGGRANAQPPSAQRFWVARASSAHAAGISWKIRDGQYRAVIMSATGHGGFAATTGFGITLPNIADYAIAGLLLGLLMAGGGTALLIPTNRPSPNDSNTLSPTTSPAAAVTL